MILMEDTHVLCVYCTWTWLWDNACYVVALSPHDWGHLCWRWWSLQCDWLTDVAFDCQHGYIALKTKHFAGSFFFWYRNLQHTQGWIVFKEISQEKLPLKNSFLSCAWVLETASRAIFGILRDGPSSFVATAFCFVPRLFLLIFALFALSYLSGWGLKWQTCKAQSITIPTAHDMIIRDISGPDSHHQSTYLVMPHCWVRCCLLLPMFPTSLVQRHFLPVRPCNFTSFDAWDGKGLV